MELEYAQVDVFAKRALEGNMLGIFPDARGLTEEQMQALARETNLSETTFILPEQDQSAGVRVRIFTTEEELPFAGHPTLGTASWLYWNHPTLRGAEQIRLRLAAGTIPVWFEPERAGPGVFGTMRQNDPVFGAVHDPAEVARVLGMRIADFDSRVPIETVSTGVGFAIVPFVSVEALGRLASVPVAVQNYLRGGDAKFFYCVAQDGEGKMRARMQFYNGEDPATGSAAGCALSWFVRHGWAKSGQKVEIVQGIEVRRPSLLEGSARLDEGRVTDVFVGGRTIPVAAGRFSVQLLS